MLIQSVNISLSKCFARASLAFFSLFFVAISTAALSQEEVEPDNSASAWLAKMSEAKRTLNFQISFVLLKNGVEVQPYIWRHGVDEQGREMEQLMQLNGPGREVVRMDKLVSYFEPNDPAYTLASGFIDGPLPKVLLQDPLTLAQGYDFFLVGKNRISGRAAQQIRLVSKDKSRFGWNLWLDQETGLILKVHMVDGEGRPLEQIQITEIQITEQPDPYFSKIDQGKLPNLVRLAEPQEQSLQWTLDYLPVGMKQVKQNVHQLPMNGGPVQYMMLSDGLVDVSVYLQSATNRDNQNEILGSFESNVYLTRQQGNALITVIGKIPPQTANAIASSVSMVN